MTGQLLSEKVLAFTEENALFEAPCRVLIGLSGGADSMSLLHCLHNWPKAGLEICAVHVHHGLRGAEADRDEAFVREQCAQLGVPLYVEHADVAAEAQANGETVEQAGRRVRYAVFEKQADVWQADYIATAHTADDQTETVLLHLLRGSGVDGLAGIPAKRGRLVRPLLCCTREEIEAYCAACAIPYIVDSTNTDTAYTRNRVRHELLPLLRQFNGAADESIRRLAAHAAQDSAYLHALAADALSRARLPKGYSAAAFIVQAVPVRRRMLRQLLAEVGAFDISESHLLAMEQAVLRKNGGVDLPDGHRLTVSQGVVFWQTDTPAVPAPDCVPIALSDLPQTLTYGLYRFTLKNIKIENEEHFENVHKMFFKYAVDCDRIQGDLYIRTRREGDVMHPAGRCVGKTIKKLMNELKVPVAEREQFPLLCDDGGVLLLAGYCCDERVRPQANTKHFLVWEPAEEQG